MNLDIDSIKSCDLCPRECYVDRTSSQRGWCGATDEIRISRAALHFWEEPPISGADGSGAIFFSGCSLKCVFCQNSAISRGIAGETVSVSRLAKIMLELEQQGANNINLVTPMHFAPHIRQAVKLAKTHGLSIPIVCNTGGYEKASVVRSMSDIVDIWLVDFKYADSTLAQNLSRASDYPEVCSSALREMVRVNRLQGGRVLDDNGIMQKGIIVRHLILPGHTDDSKHVLDEVLGIAGDEVDISLMNQYTPNAQCIEAGGKLSHKLSGSEYDEVLDYADDLGFKHIWWQEDGTQSESFIPEFDLTGVLGDEL